jgi:SRSO17 transposase
LLPRGRRGARRVNDRRVISGIIHSCVLAPAGETARLSTAPIRRSTTASTAGAARGRPRQRHVPDILSMAAEDMLADGKWQHQLANWHKGKAQARFAAVRVRTADGPPQRIRDKGQQHLPGEEAWLIGEHRTSGEKKYYLANLPAETDLRTLAASIKARWICEQAHQQLKEELGLDHFEGRSWQGLHRHALMTMIAYAFLQHRRLTTARREKKNRRATPSAKLASRAPRYRRSHHSTASAMPAPPKMARRRRAA